MNSFFGVFAVHSSLHEGIETFFHEKLGRFGEFLHDVILHGFLDTLKLVLFLFLTYMLMEFIEHKASDKAEALMKKAGGLGPVLGSLFGCVPQCGFSAAAASLFSGRVITLGTLLAVFLSTSDEMLPILIAGDIGIDRILIILGYKLLGGALVGVLADVALRLFGHKTEDISIECLCEEGGCHCERGILRSALHHTLTVSVFILVINIIIGSLFFFIEEDVLSKIFVSIPVLSHLICAAVGLIPNCAVSVLLSELMLSGLISEGAMLSGLFAGAGVGILVLFRVNKRRKENIFILSLLVISGVVFGLIFDILHL